MLDIHFIGRAGRASDFVTLIPGYLYHPVK
jgi:hypothetical protein